MYYNHANHGEKAIHVSSVRGPYFGDTYSTLSIVNEPMNAPNAGRTRCGRIEYLVEEDSYGCSILTGTKDSFTVAELECYEVIYE